MFKELKQIIKDHISYRGQIIKLAKSNLINTGIYIFKYDIFKYIPENEFFDFAKNVFPSLLKANEKINTYKTDGYWSDIGSIEQYTASNHDVFDKKILPEIKSKLSVYALPKVIRYIISIIFYIFKSVL